ncbi:uncharacterized protein METZ01_LOCUS156507, partial [marine metagenome]
MIKKLLILVIVILLTACVSPTEEIIVPATEELESAVAVALNETQITQPPPTEEITV